MNGLIIKKRQDFMLSEAALHIRSQLEQMVKDASFNTQPGYSADTGQYPDNMIPFVDKHLNYLYVHPALEPVQYLANLRLKTRVR